MKILVTGAAGFIGSHTCERLVANGHQVVGVDSFDSYLYGAVPKRKTATLLQKQLGDAFLLLEINICDVDAITKIFSEYSFDVVCHLAALAGVRPSLQEPLRYIQNEPVWHDGSLGSMSSGKCISYGLCLL